MCQQGEELNRLKIVMGFMKNGSDKDATEVLARLRLGESVEQLASLLQEESPAESVISFALKIACELKADCDTKDKGVRASSIQLARR